MQCEDCGKVLTNLRLDTPVLKNHRERLHCFLSNFAKEVNDYVRSPQMKEDWKKLHEPLEK